MILRLEFDGWCQLRLPTDPDPTDEPRGVSGYTFALAGEPDLDRVLRLQDPPAGTVRSHGPAVGVRVRQVILDGRVQRAHDLLGGRVDLLDGPRFHSRNRIIADPGHEPIDPFHLEIQGQRCRIARKDLLDPRHPRLSVWEAQPELLRRRAPRRFAMSQRSARTVARRTGIPDFAAHLRNRRDLLREESRSEENPVARAALTRRLTELDEGLANPYDRRVIAFIVLQYFHFDMNGPARVSPPTHHRLLGGRCDTSRPWRVAFSLGGWDPDALCAHMKGRLMIPLAGSARVQRKKR